ncbi:MAG: LysR family transcriptional regulator [Lachnospiraceae bacterium]|nr:LysR family transcriptional regulator [Lachnospiraceae bacterium]
MTLQQIRYVIMVANTGSMNEAAKKLFISQPSLSGAIRELETEMGINIFSRTSRGVVLTAEGEDFLGYARQILSQVELLEERYLDTGSVKKKFGVSTQHYSFAVKAFVEMVKKFDTNEYEFAIRETKTSDVIRDVRNGKSEIGILYLDEFNEKVLCKLFRENQLEFHELFQCKAYVYLWKGHPLAEKEKITMQELEEYPCLSFEQGDNNSFYFAEEILSTYDYKQNIKACDRATMLNLMIGLNGYTLCSGIICEEINGSDYRAVPLETSEIMRIGYLLRKGENPTPICRKYIEEIQVFEKYKF